MILFRCGSPALPTPTLTMKKGFSPASAVTVSQFGKSDCAMLPPNNRLVGNTLLTYDHDDRILRLKNGRIRLNLLKPEIDDRINVVEPIDRKQIVIGFTSGLVQTWTIHTNTVSGNPQISNGIYLFGHTARITAFTVCREYSIIVSSSDDCTAIIWDLNEKTYIRSLYGHPSAVTSVASSPRTGEIVTVCSLDNQRHSQLRLWMINGQLVEAANTDSPILCTHWTNAQEGRSCNAILTGHIDGSIQFWSSLNLARIRTLSTSAASCISLALSKDGLFLFSLGSDGLLSVWAQNDQNKDNRKPIVVSFGKDQ